MPRGPRVLMKNVCYHLIARGNQKQDIFREEEDFKVYLLKLRKYKIKYHFQIYGYCLMPNHVHIMGEIKQPSNLAKFMHGINRSYTEYFNKKYNMVGHLWQDRFKSKIIVRDRYLLDCIQYIELNPVRAEITKTPAEYKWSSFLERVLAKSLNNNGLLDELHI
ncbi:MAG: transposase [Candidatus Omnitrophica bacterium]|nr:transposase [Candidatus Omnitrophota bacterium]MCM8771286.1 transposase [Candidatus Omnitrophota bacterium]